MKVIAVSWLQNLGQDILNGYWKVTFICECLTFMYIISDTSAGYAIVRNYVKVTQTELHSFILNILIRKNLISLEMFGISTFISQQIC